MNVYSWICSEIAYTKVKEKLGFGAALPLFYQTVTEVRTECIVQKASAGRSSDWRAELVRPPSGTRPDFGGGDMGKSISKAIVAGLAALAMAAAVVLPSTPAAAGGGFRMGGGGFGGGFHGGGGGWHGGGWGGGGWHGGGWNGGGWRGGGWNGGWRGAGWRGGGWHGGWAGGRVWHGAIGAAASGTTAGGARRSPLAC